MKKSGKIIIVTLLLFISFHVQSQVRFGIRGGLNVSNLSGIEYSHDYYHFDGLDFRAGFHVGILSHIMFTEKMGIETGFYYSQMGGKETIYASQSKTKLDCTPGYLQLPILFMYKFRLSKDFYLYPSSGLYFAYGVTGDTKVREYYRGTNSSRTDDFFGEDYRRFDMGPVFAFNMQYQHFLMTAGFEVGLISVNKNTRIYSHDSYYYDDRVHIFNNCFKLSAGYLF